MEGDQLSNLNIPKFTSNLRSKLIALNYLCDLPIWVFEYLKAC